MTNTGSVEATGLRLLADALDAGGASGDSSLWVTMFARDAAQAQAVLAAADQVLDVKTGRSATSEDHRFSAKLRFGDVKVDFWANPAWVCDLVATRTVELSEWRFRGQAVAAS